MSMITRRGFGSVLSVVAFFFLSPAAQGQPLTFTTLAGRAAGSDDGMGSAARFYYPRSVASDRSGNLYVADNWNNTIRKITPAGAVATLAGLAGYQGSADGTGSAARFHSPSGVAVDLSGNVYVADTSNHTIRKISAAGKVTTLAGLADHYGTADGAGSTARFGAMNGVGTDSSGNIYVADSSSYTIRKITPTGAVTTLAGLAGAQGSVDGIGSAARFYAPNSVASDGSGNVYVADGYAIRRITPAGVVTTLTNGTVLPARFGFMYALATDATGNVYAGDMDNETIRKITPAGEITTVAGFAGSRGSADGIGSAARFNGPSGVATDSSGNLYVADLGNHTIRKINSAGLVTTFAGSPAALGSADGTGSAAQFNGPFGLTCDSGGNVYVADEKNYTIRKITPAGTVTTLAGLAGAPGSAEGTVGSVARFLGPVGVAADSFGNIYVADHWNNTIRKIYPGGTVTTLAGLSATSGRFDGPGSSARFYNPYGVATDSDGNVYVADTWNHTIRKITPGGMVTTVAGLAGAQGYSDGIGTYANFSFPYGLAADGSGNIYVADTFNGSVRKITPAGTVTTLGGKGQFGASGVAADNSGNVYVASYTTIQKITLDGAVTTVGGLSGAYGSSDGTGRAARFLNATGVATDNSGNVYVADSLNNTISIGRQALADLATIDLPSGSLYVTRQLDTSPRTATSWNWSVIRRPADSAADLSSATVPNPTFTPDVPGLFTFRLIATGAAATSITTVDLMVSEPARRRPSRP